MAVETLVKTGMAIVAGEVTTSTYVELEELIRQVILDIGYNSSVLGFDGGACDCQFGPLTYMLNYPDHCLLFRYVPYGIDKTDMEIVWFVRGDAVDGVESRIARTLIANGEDRKSVV